MSVRCDVRLFVGEPLVEVLVVAGLDPLLGRVDGLVSVVVAHFVGVECLFGRQREFVGHGPMVPDTRSG